MKKAIYFLIYIVLLSSFIPGGVVFAAKWNPFAKNPIILNLISYNPAREDYIKKECEKFSEIYNDIIVNISYETNKKSKIALDIDENGNFLPIVNETEIIPVEFDGIGIMYDKSILDSQIKLPQTFRELEYLCKDLIKNDISPFDGNNLELFKNNVFLQKFVKANSFNKLSKHAMKVISLKDYTEIKDKSESFGFIPFPKSNTLSENKLFAHIESALLISYDAPGKVREAGQKFISFINNN